MNQLDPRILRVGVEIGGRLKIYEGMNIVASGCKYANPTQNECEVRISNLDNATRDFLLTETSPFNKNRRRKLVRVEAGRRSTGTSLVFQGDITQATVSQPPDVTITLKALTGDYAKGNIVARATGAATPLRTIAQQVAADLGLVLVFEATDHQIANYSFTGGAIKQVNRLGELGRVNAFIDDGQLVVKNYNAPLKGNTRVLNLETGLIGIPEFTEQGVKARMLFDNQTRLGSGLLLRSVINPAVNGVYTVYKLNFELASRDTPFYYTAEAVRR